MTDPTHLDEPVQREMIFEQDAERLSPTELHGKLSEESIFFSQFVNGGAKLVHRGGVKLGHSAVGSLST